MTHAPAIGCRELARMVDGELHGDGDIQITGVAELRSATRGQLTFIGDDRYASLWTASEASAALVGPDIELEPGSGRALLRVADADLAMARVLEHFAPAPPAPEPGVHRLAVVHDCATLGQGVRIGPHCFVGPGCVVGDGCVLHANVTVMDHARLGPATVLWPGVVIRERCTLGERCILHANVTIGADGFGYRPAADGTGLVKIPQIGTVAIADDVEIGAGTCIDRAKFDATTIGRGTKIDNLVQIGHNAHIGRHVIIAGSCGIAGSVTIGDGSVLGGMVAIRDHIVIGRGVRLTGAAQLMHDIPDGETWGGSPARPIREAVKQAQALKRLPDILKQLRQRG